MMRAADFFQSRGNVVTQNVEWPSEQGSEPDEMESLGFALMQAPVMQGSSADQKAFAVYGRYPDGTVRRHTPTFPVPWIEGYTYALLPFVGYQRQGKPVFLKTLSDVEGYMRSQLDPNWISTMSWPAIPLRYFIGTNALVGVDKPGTTRWLGIIQSVGFGQLDASGWWQPMSMGICPADVHVQRLGNGAQYRFEAKPIPHAPVHQVEAEWVSLLRSTDAELARELSSQSVASTDLQAAQRPASVTQPRVFVSHSHEDNAFGVKLVEGLRRALGSEDVVWYDAHGGLRGGDDWWSTIVGELTTRPVFIMVLSPAGLSSSWVMTEFNMAFNQWHSPEGKLIIPVLFQPCEPRADIKLLQWVSFVDKPYEQAFADLLAALSAKGTRSQAIPSPTAMSLSPLELNQHLFRQHADVTTRPNIIPVGASLGGLDSASRLQANAKHAITLENGGEVRASSICAVLFPSSKYHGTGSTQSILPSLWGTYWQGQVSTSLAPSATREIVLHEARWPLQGDDYVSPQHTLYAPEQPGLGAGLTGLGHFYSARLTITYRNASGARFATIFDLDAERLAQNRDPVWRQIAWPTEVEHDLLELTDLMERKRQPPRLDR